MSFSWDSGPRRPRPFNSVITTTSCKGPGTHKYLLLFIYLDCCFRCCCCVSGSSEPPQPGVLPHSRHIKKKLSLANKYPNLKKAHTLVTYLMLPASAQGSCPTVRTGESCHHPCCRCCCRRRRCRQHLCRCCCCSFQSLCC